MSEDGFSDCLEEPNIEIHIKTLMGTTFDIRISSNDTVADIKKKIFRVEGIPIYQQNLLFRSEELKDCYRLCDCGIINGSTLTLVSSMRGGPISTRRLSASLENHFLKELKELLENTRDEITPGSKVSVLVFKEGDIINLLRVIENEDGSYSPYSDNPISPPSKPSRRDTMEAFERLVEDTEMSSKIALVRQKLEELNMKRQNRNNPSESKGTKVNPKDFERKTGINSDEEKKSFSYKFLEECSEELMDNMDLKIFEKSLDEENQSENEEIALKDKHRTKPKVLQSLPIPKSNSKSLYSEKKGPFSPIREHYARMTKKRESKLFEKTDKNQGLYNSYSNRRIIESDEWEGSSLLKSNVSYSDMLSNDLPNSNFLKSLGPSLSPISLTLKSSESSKISTSKSNCENPYLLEGLNSNQLPDISVLDKDDFVTEGLSDAVDNSDENSSSSDNNNYLRLSIPNEMNVSAGTNSRLLPDLTTRLEYRRFGPLISENNSPSVSGNRTAKSSSFSTPSNNSGYSLPSLNKLTQSQSLESSPFSNLSSKLQSSNHSVSRNDNLTQLTNTSENAMPCLSRLSLSHIPNSRGESPILEDSGGALSGSSVEEMGAKLAEQLHLLDDEPNTDVYGESLSVSARNRVHLTRLVLSSEGAERPKSSPDSIELEEHAQDIWEIHEPASERIKRSATCKVGLLKRRQGLEYNYDSLENSQANLKPDLGNLGNYSKSSSEFGVCSGTTNYFMPQYLSSPSAIPPQYAPKQHQNYCDFIFRNEPRSPLYSRRNRKENLEVKPDDCSSSLRTVEGDCSSIQRLKNDNNVFGPKEQLLDDLYGLYNLNYAADILEKRDEDKKLEMKLPPLIKKKSRCNECNKRLNITNIYNCRCGRIFCSQHRYSEVHRCNYDYKTEGRKILEQQNPLVTGQKVQRF